MDKMEVREIEIERLHAAEYNPRVALRKGDPEYEKLRASIIDLGLIDPIIWNEDTGNVVGGHQRLTVLADLGRKTAPCVVLHLTPEKERVANLALNKITGRWDDDKLREIIDGLSAADVAVAGFDAKDLRALYEQRDTSVHEDDFDVGASYAEHAEPRTKPGDLITLGESRLLCGDATRRDDAARLFGDNLADMVFTDPPYNVDYHSSDGSSIMNDRMSDQRFYSFLFDAFACLYAHVKPGGAIYVCHADSEGLNFRMALKDSGFLVKQCLVWVKNALVMGRQDYHWQHEPILYGWKPGARHSWCGDRKQSTAIHPDDALSIEAEQDGSYTLLFNVGFDSVRVRVPEFEIVGKSEGSDVWLFDKPRKNSEHPTMKPIGLCARAIRNSCERGALVADMFGGSGSTIIAAEQLERRCYMMELDPRYCDVIVDRWQASTGGVARYD